MWIDEPEQMVRYLEYQLDAEWGEGKRLVPLPLARIKKDGVKIHSIYAEHFRDVPRNASATRSASSSAVSAKGSTSRQPGASRSGRVPLPHPQRYARAP